MRCFEALLLVLGTGCAAPLHDDGEAIGAADAAPSLPLARGCLPFQGVASQVSGAIRSVAVDGGTVFVVDDAVIAGEDVAAVALTSTSPALTDCLASAVPSSPPVSTLPSLVAPRAAVTIDGTISLFYETLGSGFGVTRLGVAPGVALWTSDRPSYGTAAVVQAATVYVYGCLGTGYLSDDCYVARAPADGIASESAYEYYVGGGRWSASVDDAWPMVGGGGEMDVTWLASRNRWLMAYVTPLGTTITLRSGLSPEGPWSAPIEAATCDLADADMFCAGVHFHPSVVASGDAVALSYSVSSLSSDVAMRRTADPLAWWPRIFALTIPPLP